MSVFIITILISCCIGIPLNGIVIWLLGFQIKRNPFTILILNLAVADFGHLVFLAIFCIRSFIVFMQPGIASLAYIMYVNGLFLLTTISIEQCVCVLFPIWHRSSRPKHLSPAVCAFLWICSVLLVGIQKIVINEFEYIIWPPPHLVVPSVFCLPLITISTLILLVKICPKPRQIKCGRLLVMILITLLRFFILTMPLHIYVFIHFSDLIFWRQFPGLEKYIILGACLNSSVNPVVYYLVGRKKRAQTSESIKDVFQRVFREDEEPENTSNRVSSLL